MRAKRSARVALTLLASLLAPLVVGVRLAPAVDWWPPGAAQRYDEAKQLMQQGRHTQAADAYREVAEWPEGGVFPQRAEALFLSGVMEEKARRYERAIATYRDVTRRFPGDEFSKRAAVLADAIEQGDPARGIAFRRRLDTARDGLSAANARLQREGVAAVQGELERVAAMLTAMLEDYRDLPKAKDVALALGDTHATLGRYRDAQADYRQAIELIRRETDRPGSDPREAERDLSSAENVLAEVTRTIWRTRVTRTAWALLAMIGVGLVLARPWRALDRRMLRLGGAFVLGTGLLAMAALRIGHYIRHNVEDQPPLEHGVPALLVLLPGIAGEIVALGYLSRLSATSMARRWAAALASLLGAIAALAVAICIIHAFQLFPFLDSRF